jgi:hypothetical protein
VCLRGRAAAGSRTSGPPTHTPRCSGRWAGSVSGHGPGLLDSSAACGRALRPFCALCDSSCNLLDAGLSSSWVYTYVYEVSRTFGGAGGYSYTFASGPTRVSHKDALLHICTAALPMQGARDPSRCRGGVNTLAAASLPVGPSDRVRIHRMPIGRVGTQHWSGRVIRAVPPLLIVRGCTSMPQGT